MDFRFTNEYPVSRIDEIVSYLLGPRLWIAQTDYPDFSDWAEKAHAQLLSEKKRALVALERNNIIGVVVYQKHKKHADALEMKNLTVRPDRRGRYIASFLMRNAEIEGGREFKAKYAIGDAKASNTSMRMFLLRNGYRVLAKDDLYKLGAGEDLIYKKTLSC